MFSLLFFILFFSWFLGKNVNILTLCCTNEVINMFLIVHMFLESFIEKIPSSLLIWILLGLVLFMFRRCTTSQYGTVVNNTSNSDNCLTCSCDLRSEKQKSSDD